MVYGIFDLPSSFSPLYLSGYFKNYLGFVFWFFFLALSVVLKEIEKELQIYIQKLMENEYFVVYKL